MFFLAVRQKNKLNSGGVSTILVYDVLVETLGYFSDSTALEDRAQG